MGYNKNLVMQAACKTWQVDDNKIVTNFVIFSSKRVIFLPHASINSMLFVLPRPNNTHQCILVGRGSTNFSKLFKKLKWILKKN